MATRIEDEADRGRKARTWALCVADRRCGPQLERLPGQRRRRDPTGLEAVPARPTSCWRAHRCTGRAKGFARTDHRNLILAPTFIRPAPLI